eukprot:15356197-Ditylum_brightwellii.AAC.1
MLIAGKEENGRGIATEKNSASAMLARNCLNICVKSNVKVPMTRGSSNSKKSEDNCSEKKRLSNKAVQRGYHKQRK